MPLPRLWLLEAGKENLLQLQVNRFHFNWRRLEEAEVHYPRFEKHLDRTLDYWERFAGMVSGELGEPLQIESAEVVKVTQIYEGNGWQGDSAISSLFPVLNFNRLPADSAIRGFSFSLGLTVEGQPVRLGLKSAHKKADKDKRLLQMEIHVPVEGIEATSSDQGNLRERLESANGTANLAFTSMTSEEAQKDVWRRKY